MKVLRRVTCRSRHLCCLFAILVYTTQVSSAFGARLLASLKVIIQEDIPKIP